MPAYFSNYLDVLELFSPIIAGCFFFSFLFSIIYAVFHRELNPTNISKTTFFMTCFLVFLSFSIFGSTIGIFIGASKNSIVKDILPIIITMITGYFTYITTNNQNGVPSWILTLIPAIVLLILLNLVLSAFYMKLPTSG